MNTRNIDFDGRMSMNVQKGAVFSRRSSAGSDYFNSVTVNEALDGQSPLPSKASRL